MSNSLTLNNIWRVRCLLLRYGLRLLLSFFFYVFRLDFAVFSRIFLFLFHCEAISMEIYRFITIINKAMMYCYYTVGKDMEILYYRGLRYWPLWMCEWCNFQRINFNISRSEFILNWCKFVVVVAADRDLRLIFRLIILINKIIL